MSRKDTNNYVIYTGSGASAFDTKSTPTNIQFQDNAGIQVVWSGTLVGELKILVSNDSPKGPIAKTPVNWSELDFGTSILIDATNSDILINMNQLSFTWLAVDYTATSGTGNITISLTTKATGG